MLAAVVRPRRGRAAPPGRHRRARCRGHPPEARGTRRAARARACRSPCTPSAHGSRAATANGSSAQPSRWSAARSDPSGPCTTTSASPSVTTSSPASQAAPRNTGAEPVRRQVERAPGRRARVRARRPAARRPSPPSWRTSSPTARCARRWRRRRTSRVAGPGRCEQPGHQHLREGRHHAVTLGSRPWRIRSSTFWAVVPAGRCRHPALAAVAVGVTEVPARPHRQRALAAAGHGRPARCRWSATGSSWSPAPRTRTPYAASCPTWHRPR